MDPPQHFFPVTSIVSWASHAFPKMWSLMIVKHNYNIITFVPMKVFKGKLPNFANTMDVLVVFRTLSKDLRNLQYTTSITSIFLKLTQTSQI
jgi:hypothetical protein